MKKKTIAALQVGSASGGTSETLSKILSFESQIESAECDLLVMPEALLGGYPKGADFGTRVGYRTEQGRKEYLQYWKQSVEIDGPEVAEIAKLAKRCNTTIVIGVIETGQATLYCTALFISNRGKILAKHRKLVPTASERLIWGRGDGSTIPVIETPAGKIGAAICWENYMPLLRTAMYAKGIEIWCAPTVDDRELWQTSMRHIAYEGRNFLVSACQFQSNSIDAEGDASQYPRSGIRGGSVIISPMGEVLAGPLFKEEGLLSVEIDLDDLIKARYDMDVTGHYARPDIFELSIDDQERPRYKQGKKNNLGK